MKAHLFDSNEPAKEGSTLAANCGVPVPNAQFVFLWDNEQYPEFLAVSMTRICRPCAQLELEKKYVYGIVAGQEAFDEEHQNFRLQAPEPKSLQTDFPGKETA